MQPQYPVSSTAKIARNTKNTTANLPNTRFHKNCFYH